MSSRCDISPKPSIILATALSEPSNLDFTDCSEVRRSRYLGKGLFDRGVLRLEPDRVILVRGRFREALRHSQIATRSCNNLHFCFVLSICSAFSASWKPSSRKVRTSFFPDGRPASIEAPAPTTSVSCSRVRGATWTKGSSPTERRDHPLGKLIRYRIQHVFVVPEVQLAIYHVGISRVYLKRERRRLVCAALELKIRRLEEFLCHLGLPNVSPSAGKQQNLPRRCQIKP